MQENITLAKINQPLSASDGIQVKVDNLRNDSDINDLHHLP